MTGFSTMFSFRPHVYAKFQVFYVVMLSTGLTDSKEYTALIFKCEKVIEKGHHCEVP